MAVEVSIGKWPPSPPASRTVPNSLYSPYPPYSLAAASCIIFSPRRALGDPKKTFSKEKPTASLLCRKLIRCYQVANCNFPCHNIELIVQVVHATLLFRKYADIMQRNWSRASTGCYTVFIIYYKIFPFIHPYLLQDIYHISTATPSPPTSISSSPFDALLLHNSYSFLPTTRQLPSSSSPLPALPASI